MDAKAYHGRMPNARYRSPMPVSAEELFAWHRRPNAFARITPPWENARLLEAPEPWGDGTRWIIRTQVLGPIAFRWVAEHFNIIPDRQFCDRQIHGPFHSWEHTHRFNPDGPTSLLEDEIDYTLPLGWPGRMLAGGLIRRRIDRMFAWRHWITRSDLERHAEVRDRPRLTVAITGSRGLIGTELVNFLTTGGHHVIRLLSDASAPPKYSDGTEWRAWRPREPLPAGALSGVDAVVHLAGANIAERRWTAARKLELRESRVIPTRHLAEAAARDGVPSFLSGSAVGIYGNRGNEALPETAEPGTGFLADLGRDWEAAAAGPRRVVLLRTGIVLSPKGGALAKQLPAFRLGGGAVLGSGEQIVPWIDIQDMVYTIHHLLMQPEIAGPVNLCAPQAVSNRVFGRTLARVLHRPFLFTAPRFLLRLGLGELADEALLAGQRAQPAALQASGYRFANESLEDALRNMLP